jgi:hypothetical protein
MQTHDEALQAQPEECRPGRRMAVPGTPISLILMADAASALAAMLIA